MATTTHNATIALDDGTLRRLTMLAARWKVSRAEAVRRSVEQAENSVPAPPDAAARIATARRLRESLQKRKVDVAAWIQTARNSRR